MTVEFPSQRPVTRSFDVFFDLGGWVNNREASDSRRHRAHYDVTVMGNVITLTILHHCNRLIVCWNHFSATSMAYCSTAVTPLLTHRSNCSLACINYRYEDRNTALTGVGAMCATLTTQNHAHPHPTHSTSHVLPMHPSLMRTRHFPQAEVLHWNRKASAKWTHLYPLRTPRQHVNRSTQLNWVQFSILELKPSLTVSRFSKSFI